MNIHILDNPFHLISYFQLLSVDEQIQWKSLMKSKYQWFQPDSILLQRNQRVTTAYLIARGIVQCKDETKSTCYKCGNIIGIDALFTEKSLSYGTYTANGGLVETYLIDSILLNTLLSDEKMSRLIYNEIALHMIMSNYQKSFKLNHSQLQMLLNEKTIFYRNQSDFFLQLQSNQRLFLLSGTINHYSNEQKTIVDSIHFISHTFPTNYHLNSTSIVYIWTYEDEIYYSNIKKFKIHFSMENNEVEPVYLGDTIEFTPRRRSFSLTRPVENNSNLQLIPSEIEVTNELNIPTEFSL